MEGEVDYLVLTFCITLMQKMFFSANGASPPSFFHPDLLTTPLEPIESKLLIVFVALHEFQISYALNMLSINIGH
jgi:hypothetical protein